MHTNCNQGCLCLSVAQLFSELLEFGFIRALCTTNPCHISIARPFHDSGALLTQQRATQKDSVPQQDHCNNECEYGIESREVCQTLVVMSRLGFYIT